MTKLKLSELNDDVELVNEIGGLYSVGEMKTEIHKFNENFSDKKIYGSTWYVAEPDKWEPDAKWMVERYVDCECDEMYEDWDQRILDCFIKEDYQKLQSILDEVVKRDNGVINYYHFGNEIEIDILPNK